MGDKIEKENGGQFSQGFKGYQKELGPSSVCSWKQLDNFRQGSKFINESVAAGWMRGQSSSNETS